MRLKLVSTDNWFHFLFFSFEMIKLSTSTLLSLILLLAIGAVHATYDCRSGEDACYDIRNTAHNAIVLNQKLDYVISVLTANQTMPVPNFPSISSASMIVPSGVSSCFICLVTLVCLYLFHL